MKKVILAVLSLAGFLVSAAVLAGTTATGTTDAGVAVGVGSVAQNVTDNLSQVAKLITGASYVAGMAFAVGAIIKFKAHKDNPTQIPIGTPIALLFVGAALIFIPSVYTSGGATLFGESGLKTAPGTKGVASFVNRG